MICRRRRRLRRRRRHLRRRRRRLRRHRRRGTRSSLVVDDLISSLAILFLTSSYQLIQIVICEFIK